MHLTEEWLLKNGISRETLAVAKGEGKAINVPMPKPSGPKRSPSARAGGLGLLPMIGGPGPWRVEIPGWRPVSLNVLLSLHWSKRGRIKKRAYELIGQGCFEAGVTEAMGKRRVSIEIGYPKRMSRYLDEDNTLKLIRDGLVECGALYDDGPRWIETGSYEPVKVPKSTAIIIEDV